MNKNRISYVDYSWNPLSMRCSFKACPCRSTCWHLQMADRMSKNPQMPKEKRDAWAGVTGPYLDKKELMAPLEVKKPSRIAVHFMGDLFDEEVGIIHLAKIFSACVRSPQHQFLVLTKQVNRMVELCVRPVENIYWGVTVTNQADTDRMIPKLLKVPGKKWVSAELLFDGFQFNPHWLGACDCGEDPGSHSHGFLDWIVVGSSNNPRKHPCKLEWIQSIVDQCRAACVPVFVKQIPVAGKVCHDINQFPESLRVRERL